jgi:hypothetical protein
VAWLLFSGVETARLPGWENEERNRQSWKTSPEKKRCEWEQPEVEDKGKKVISPTFSLHNYEK